MSAESPTTLVNKTVNTLFEVVSELPDSSEDAAANPKKRADSIIFLAAGKAGTVSSTLAIPPGPLGFATILPDLLSVWNIQRQMVADIAAAYGKSATLTREQMIFCLFRHAAVQAVSDLAVRVGGRVVVKRASLRVIQTALKKIGFKVTQRATGKVISRWLPVVGPVAMGTYSFLDTKNVGSTALDLFSSEIAIAA